MTNVILFLIGLMVIPVVIFIVLINSGKDESDE